MDTLVDRMHREIEVMTRRLELEKRRLKRLEKELTAAQKTQSVKESQARQRQNALRLPTPRRPQSGSNSRDLPRMSMARPTLTEGRATITAVPQEEEVGLVPMKQLVAQMDYQVRKLDTVRHENDGLKQDVQQIRKCKRQLGFIFQRLKIQISHRSDQIRDFVEEAAQSKAVYAETEQRVEVMQRQREDERRQFTEEVLRIRRDLRKLEADKREVEVRLKRMEGVQRKNSLIMPPEETEFSESSMMRRIMKTAFLNCIQRRHIKQHQKSIEIFEQAFATIKQSTGISDIAEIVKIFVHLESRNFSLLTYVNHMNREIEALEGQRRNRRDGERQLKRREETNEKNRELALGDMQKKLRATQMAMEDDKEAWDSQRSVLHQILPQMEQVAKQLDQESGRLRQAARDADGSELPARPSDELRMDTMLTWLQWVEEVLSRFKDLLPVEPAAMVNFFPATAAGLVKQLHPKRPHQPLAPLVKAQDLPAVPALAEEHTQKRQAQKIDLEEDSEEEGFEDRPLMIKEIRSRAEMAQARKNRSRDHRHSVAFLEQDNPTVSSGLQLFAQEARKTETFSTAPDLHTSRRSVGFSLGATPDTQLETLRLEAAKEEGGSMDSGSESPPPRSALNLRVRQLIEVAAAQPEVTQDDLDISFLRKYKMSRQELEVLAGRMGMGLQHLCFLKTQFDLFDQDQSGYISAAELRNLFVKLGEDITDANLADAVTELDTDQSGEIEFFEFVEWFCTN
ncbi:unnamed protein product [Effrenium voratum]|uniref:EF-hand domain-containing protein n=1 Tax=Effrenium voratum TaxID=2562239 RepID=A0AA36I918_9DINO|nr:unnamed protein product [Effrenium voratum]CAJ1417726.1 unnamed protein product [Effrenium voratum]